MNLWLWLAIIQRQRRQFFISLTQRQEGVCLVTALCFRVRSHGRTYSRTVKAPNPRCSRGRNAFAPPIQLRRRSPLRRSAR